jgi:hypothetical protein
MVSENTHPAWPTVSLVLVALISYYLRMNPGILDRLFPLHDQPDTQKLGTLETELTDSSPLSQQSTLWTRHPDGV